MVTIPAATNPSFLQKNFSKIKTTGFLRKNLYFFWVFELKTVFPMVGFWANFPVVWGEHGILKQKNKRLFTEVKGFRDAFGVPVITDFLGKNSNFVETFGFAEDEDYSCSCRLFFPPKKRLKKAKSRAEK